MCHDTHNFIVHIDNIFYTNRLSDTRTALIILTVHIRCEENLTLCRLKLMYISTKIKLLPHRKHSTEITMIKRLDALYGKNGCLF